MTLTRLIRIEALKLRTMRVTFGLFAVSVALTALFASLEASRAGKVGGAVASLSTAAGLRTVTTVTGWSLLFAAVLGALASSGEFRHAGATLTYLAEPRRQRVVIAKAVATAGFGALFGLTSGVIATGVGLAFANGNGDPITLGSGALFGHAAGAMVAAALFATIGVCLGALVRSQVAAVIAIFVWGLVVESIIGGLFTSVRPYLPYTAATTLGGIKLGGAAFGPAHGISGGAPLSFVASTGLVLGVAMLLGLLAGRCSVNRDVT